MSLVTGAALFVLLNISLCVGQCPDQWELFQNSCLSYDPVPQSWQDAEWTCEAFGGHLATPSTEIRAIILKGFLQYKNPEPTPTVKVGELSPFPTVDFCMPLRYASGVIFIIEDKDAIWVDGKSEHGSWSWRSSKESLTYTQWLPGEPQTSHHHHWSSERCIEVTSGGQDWTSKSCHDHNAFVCEIKTRPVHVTIIG